MNDTDINFVRHQVILSFCSMQTVVQQVTNESTSCEE